MIIHKCDICKKELYGSWLTVRVEPDAAKPEINISKLLQLRTKVEICETCYNELRYNFISLQRRKG